jgi:hypothetical protein
MFAKRLFSVKQPKAYYQSQPYLNYLDPSEKTFLTQKYVGTQQHIFNLSCRWI